ncbi:hypothetical protein Ccrd_008358 [Cynara cardunculus var. scolymus]|uniref:Uncharacterized protein n=1 Tax=Cynara cardunculus var. scolymus TaxID=59895 RepID=A0A118JSR5_CYNCS|nr:hypothetical protein Ccrd_008358 [Cynara cardunculus var. scolymus]
MVRSPPFEQSQWFEDFRGLQDFNICILECESNLFKNLSDLQGANDIFGDLDDLLIKYKLEPTNVSRYDETTKLKEMKLEDEFEPITLSNMYMAKKDDHVRKIVIPERVQISEESTGPRPTVDTNVKSVGQEERVVEETTIEETVACDKSGSLTNSRHDIYSFGSGKLNGNIIVLERPEYGYITCSLADLVTIVKLTSCSRITLIENRALTVGDDMTEGEAWVLMEYGWIPNSGLGTTLSLGNSFW